MYGIERCRIHTPYGHRNPDRAREEPSCRRQKPLCLGTSPFSWTCGLGCFGRPGGRECSAPHHSERVPPPQASRPLSSPPLLSTMRAAAHTGGIPETPRMPSAAPHLCACGGRPLVRGCVWRHRGARARDACVPPSVGETEPTPPPRGATPTSRSRRMPPVTSHGARRAHARWRCGACWSSAQRTPESA